MCYVSPQPEIYSGGIRPLVVDLPIPNAKHPVFDPFLTSEWILALKGRPKRSRTGSSTVCLKRIEKACVSGSSAFPFVMYCNYSAGI